MRLLGAIWCWLGYHHIDDIHNIEMSRGISLNKCFACNRIYIEDRCNYYDTAKRRKITSSYVVRYDIPYHLTKIDELHSYEHRRRDIQAQINTTIKAFLKNQLLTRIELHQLISTAWDDYISYIDACINQLADSKIITYTKDYKLTIK